MGQLIANMMTTDKNARRNFERRWYDNNYFDDGHHFRYLSRLQNKIVDLSEKASLYSPMRAIPKASRQIRGVANLITSQDYVPVVYPEKVEKANFEAVPKLDPTTGQQIMTSPEYEAALKEAKMIAKRSGHWTEEEFKYQDVTSKLALMAILAAKNYVSYLQITPDAEREEIKTVVRDAFDVYLMGDVNEIEDSPHVIIAHPKVISEIKANETFDKEQLLKISPDNRQASSEIKEAYMRGRYGRECNDDSSATLILKEAYLKEHLNADNQKIISKQEGGGDILQGKKEGDIVYRQVFVAGNIWLSDKYVDLKGYPIVDFRFEPGPMYGVSMIERFIPTNKSLDMIVSRIERYAHTMTVGVWTKRQGEQFNLSNAAGGQIVEYKNIPPQQAQLAPLPSHVFNFIQLLNSFIEEQGVSTTTLGKIPQGVKAARAIESLKESEFANLVITQRQFKKTVKRIAEKLLDYADKYFVTPKTAYYLEKGEPTYFDIIGKTAMQKREELKVPVEGEVTPISGEYRVDIEVQAGLGYTREGQKAAARELGDYVVQLAQLGLVPPGVVSKVLESILEAYQFGTTAEIMEDMEEYEKEGQMTDPQMEKMKLAMAEVVRDTGMAESKDTTEEDIQKVKVGVAEAAKDLQEGGEE
jgi:hypothetical protein